MPITNSEPLRGERTWGCAYSLDKMTVDTNQAFGYNPIFHYFLASSAHH